MMSEWKEIFSLFGLTQTEQAENSGIRQSHISEKTTKNQPMHRPTKVALTVACEALGYLTSKEKAMLSKKVKARLKA